MLLFLMKEERMRRTCLLKVLVAILLVAGLLIPSTVIALTSPADGSNLLLGNPTKAIHSTSDPNNYLMTTSNYALSYNKSRGESNWVSWYLGPSSLGSTDRLNNFRADGTLPTGWYKVQANGYSGSGFDRGHNCPSADRTSSVAVNSKWQTYLTSVDMIEKATGDDLLSNVPVAIQKVIEAKVDGN